MAVLVLLAASAGTILVAADLAPACWILRIAIGRGRRWHQRGIGERHLVFAGIWIELVGFHLRQVIGLRGYGQRDPLQEYKSEAFSLFEAMIAHLREAVTAQLMRVEIVPPEEQQPVLPAMEAHKFDPNTGEDEMAFANASLVPAATADRDPKNPATWGKIGRNEDCPCGSGKKYKHCHGKYA